MEHERKVTAEEARELCKQRLAEFVAMREAEWAFLAAEHRHGWTAILKARDGFTATMPLQRGTPPYEILWPESCRPAGFVEPDLKAEALSPTGGRRFVRGRINRVSGVVYYEEW